MIENSTNEIRAFTDDGELSPLSVDPFEAVPFTDREDEFALNRTLVVEPNHPRGTELTQRWAGDYLHVRAYGRWRPGHGTHKFYGPTGSSDISYRDANKWCLLIRMHTVKDGVSYWAYPGKKLTIRVPVTLFGPATFFVQMNDDLWGDNYNESGNPMRVKY